MVDFRNPTLVVLDLWDLIKFCHTLDGIYIWEFFTTLDYEFRVIQGRQPYRWTIWLYSLTRLAALMAVIINIVTLNMETSTYCQVWVTFSFTFGFSAFALSSLLIILRVIAIWNRNKAIVGLSAIVWVANGTFLIQGKSLSTHHVDELNGLLPGCSLIRSSWVPTDSFCSPPYVRTNKKALISMFITDFVLLVIMLLGLLRLRHLGGGAFGLGRLLWKQGVIWLLLATTAELPPLVFICLNLNEAFDLMFFTPSLITMSIAATRMYRSLADFLSSTEVATDSGILPRKCHAIPNCKSTLTVPTSPTLPNRTDVKVHTAREKYPPSVMDETVLYIGRDPARQLQRDKPDDVCFDDKAEKGV